MDEKQTKDNTKHTNLRLPIETYNIIETLAINNQRTVSGQIRFMLQEYIKLQHQFNPIITSKKDAM